MSELGDWTAAILIIDSGGSKLEKNFFDIRVNGVEIKVDEEKLQARRILEIAYERGAMPGKPEEYDLQGQNHLYKADDWVDLAGDKEFITIPNTPTPVA